MQENKDEKKSSRVLKFLSNVAINVGMAYVAYKTTMYLIKIQNK